MRNTKLGVYLSNAIAVCYNSLITSYLVLAILSYNTESIHDRQFVMQAAFPEEAKRSPMFEILCLVQFIVAFFVANCHAVLEGLLTVSVCKEYLKFTVACKINVNLFRYYTRTQRHLVFVAKYPSFQKFVNMREAMNRKRYTLKKN